MTPETPEFVKSALDPIWWKRFIRRRLVGQGYYSLKNNTGMYVMEEDWDILVILDGCRHDLFEEGLEEFDRSLLTSLESRISRGASTRQFIDENFVGKEYMDTIYVTANPWIDRKVSDSFHSVIPVHITEWNEQEQTVLPRPVYERTVAVAEQYPNKRIIAHFMQPHYPFIGSDLTKKTVTCRVDSKDDAKEATDKAVSMWNLLERGEVSHDDVWKAYRGNLFKALPYAHRLANELDGRAVVTSDHGNGAGEFCWPFPVRAYGHPRNIRIDPIVKIPWLVYESDSCREPIAERQTTEREERTNDRTVDERLKQLGYKT
jgi:hypothetical protein